MEIHEAYVEKLVILAKRLSTSIEPLTGEFNKILEKINSQKNLKMGEAGKYRSAFAKLLGKYQPLLRSKKFIGIVFSKENYFDQTTWLTGKAKLHTKESGKDSALEAGWINEDGNYCDGRETLDSDGLIVNRNFKKLIQKNRGNRTVKIFGYETNREGKPQGELKLFTTSLNGSAGQDNAVTNDKIPMNTWAAFYGNKRDTQKIPGYTAINFPRQFVFTKLGDKDIEEFNLPHPYTALVDLVKKEPLSKLLLGVKNLNETALARTLAKDFSMVIMKVVIERITKTPDSLNARMSIDNGKEISLEPTDDSEDYTVFVPPYIFETINFGAGSSAILIGQPNRQQKKDAQDKPIEGEYQNAIVRAFNVMGVLGETIEIDAEEITEETVQKMSSEKSGELETVSPDVTTEDW